MNREFLENGFKKLDFIGNIDQFKEFIKTDSSMLGDSFWSDQLADNKILDCLPEFRLGGAKCKVCAFNTNLFLFHEPLCHRPRFRPPVPWL